MRAVLALLFLCSAAPCFSQGLSVAQQQKVDSLMQWISNEVKEGRTPSQHHIDSVNALVKSMNAAPTKKDSAASTSGTEITRQGSAGGSFTVPEGKVWKVKRMYVNDGGSYNVLVTSVKFKDSYKAGEKFSAPSWCSEGELLNGQQTGFYYIFKIEERPLTK